MQYLDEVFPAAAAAAGRPEGPRAHAHLDEARRRISASGQRHADLRDGACAARCARRAQRSCEAYYRGIPNPATRERQRAAIEQGMDAPAAVQALQFYDKALADMDRQLAQHPWLAGEAYSLADAAMTPYINRFTMLGLSNMWTQSRPNVAAWFERIKARPSYAAAISAFVTDADLQGYAGTCRTGLGRKAQSLAEGGVDRDAVRRQRDRRKRSKAGDASVARKRD